MVSKASDPICATHVSHQQARFCGDLDAPGFASLVGTGVGPSTWESKNHDSNWADRPAHLHKKVSNPPNSSGSVQQINETGMKEQKKYYVHIMYICTYVACVNRIFNNVRQIMQKIPDVDSGIWRWLAMLANWQWQSCQQCVIVRYLILGSRINIPCRGCSSKARIP